LGSSQATCLGVCLLCVDGMMAGKSVNNWTLGATRIHQKQITCLAEVISEVAFKLHTLEERLNALSYGGTDNQRGNTTYGNGIDCERTSVERHTICLESCLFPSKAEWYDIGDATRCTFAQEDCTKGVGADVDSINTITKWYRLEENSLVFTLSREDLDEKPKRTCERGDDNDELFCTRCGEILPCCACPTYGVAETLDSTDVISEGLSFVQHICEENISNDEEREPELEIDEHIRGETFTETANCGVDMLIDEISMKELDVRLLQTAEDISSNCGHKDEILVVLRNYTFLFDPGDDETYPDSLDRSCSLDLALEKLDMEILTAEKAVLGIDQGTVGCGKGARGAIAAWILHAKLFMKSKDKMRVLFASFILHVITTDHCMEI